MALRIGTSGWHYPSGLGTWNGIFYPLPEDRERGFDELRFYAERFNTVEINSTFYGQPRARVSLQWVRRTPEHFEFSVKLYQKFTHPGLSPGEITSADIDLFKAGIEPLAAAGKMGALLMQFPASFHDEDPAREYLEWLLTTFKDYACAVELRHRSWSNKRRETSSLLSAHAASWVQIDEPKFDNSIEQDWQAGASAIFYARLHGRNAEHWWEHEHADDRYNYRYSADELAPIAAKVRAARDLKKRIYLYLNNHFSASAVANATTLKHMLDEPVTARMPAELVGRYPELGPIVATLPRARLL
jgi:uncharacterized protein YecE (DUF72 family)